MKKLREKKVTMPELAERIKAGFSASKRHIEEQTEQLARMTKNELDEMRREFKEHTKIVMEEFRLLNAEIKDIKTTLGPTVVIVAEQEKRIQTLESRLDYVEQKVGIVRFNR